MSIKDNVDFVKEELNSEEKFLEGFVKVERFYKKYKLIIIAAVVIVIGGIIGYYVSNYFKGQTKLEANIAFNKVLENPNDQAALDTLEEKNKQLFQVAKFMQASKDGNTADIQVKFLKELTAYEKALSNKNVEQLNTLSMNNDFLLKEFAIFNKALIQTNEGKYEDAKATLQLIPADSKVNDLVNVLKHYLVTK